MRHTIRRHNTVTFRMQNRSFAAVMEKRNNNNTMSPALIGPRLHRDRNLLLSTIRDERRNDLRHDGRRMMWRSGDADVS